MKTTSELRYNLQIIEKIDNIMDQVLNLNMELLGKNNYYHDLNTIWEELYKIHDNLIQDAKHNRINEYKNKLK